MTFAAQLLADVDKVIASAVGAGATAMSGYVLPAAWVIFGITLLVWAFMAMNGLIASPMNDWLIKGGSALLILMVAGVLYRSWVMDPMLGMQKEMTEVVIADASATNVLDALDNRIESLVRSCFKTMAQLPTNPFGLPDITAVILLASTAILFSIGGAFLMIIALLNLVYAKFGLGMVLIVGPFFVASLIAKPVRGLFFSWLNTGLYFVFLSVLTAAYISMCLAIAQNYINTALTAAGAPQPATTMTESVVAIVVPFAIVFDSNMFIPLLMASIKFLIMSFILSLLGSELRTIASSITGGSGGSGFTSALSGFSRVASAARTFKSLSSAKGKP